MWVVPPYCYFLWLQAMILVKHEVYLRLGTSEIKTSVCITINQRE